MNRVLRYGLVAAAVVATGAIGQTFQSWRGPAGEELTGFVLACPTGVARAAVPCGTDANPVPVKLPNGGAGSSPATPTYTTPSGVTRTRLTCTLPAYATGGNIACTDQAGAQTTTACAANTACLVSGANANRKVAEFTNRTAGSTIDVGYSAATAPGNSKGYDGPSATNGQGGSGTENPAHVGAYYAATATANAVLVFVQGQ